MKITIVHGAPASGKTTYVKNHMKHGDLIVDLDELKKAISYCAKDMAPDSLLPVALKLRRCLMNIIYDLKVIGGGGKINVWIVTCERFEVVKALAFELCADVIEIKATKAECIDRAMKDAERLNKAKQIEIITKYFEKNQQEVNQ